METLQAIFKDLEELHDEAKFVNEQWMRAIAEREVRRMQRGNKTERTNYQLSLEFHGNSFRIRWLYIRFVKNSDRTIRVAKQVAIPRGHKYTRQNFKYAETWELELITEIEETLYPIRYKANSLMKAHQTLIRTNKKLGIKRDVTPLSKRTVKTSKSISEFKKLFR